MRVSKNAEDRRAVILEAGMAVCRTIGFADAKVSDITKAAGIAKGTFYLYFDSKAHMLGALWERYVDTVVVTAEGVLREGDTWWPTVDRLLSALLDQALSNADLHRIVYGTANAHALDICRAADERVIDLMASFITRGTCAGAFRVARPSWTCRMLYRAADSLLHELILAGAPIDAQELKGSFLELAHRALGAPPYVHPQPKGFRACPPTPCRTST